MLGQVAGDHDLLEQPAEDKREPFLQAAGIPCPVPKLRQELPGAHDRPRHDRGEEGHEQQLSNEYLYKLDIKFNNVWKD